VHQPRARRKPPRIEEPGAEHGVGSALLARTLLAARNYAASRPAYGLSRDNERMQQLASKFDAELRFDFGSVVGEGRCPASNPDLGRARVVPDTHGLRHCVARSCKGGCCGPA